MLLRSGMMLSMEGRTSRTQVTHPSEERNSHDQVESVGDSCHVEESVVVEEMSLNVESVRDSQNSETYIATTPETGMYTREQTQTQFDLTSFLANQFAAMQLNFSQINQKLSQVQQQTISHIEQKLSQVQQQTISHIEQKLSQVQEDIKQHTQDQLNKIPTEMKEVLAGHSRTLTERPDRHIVEQASAMCALVDRVDAQKEKMVTLVDSGRDECNSKAKERVEESEERCNANILAQHNRVSDLVKQIGSQIQPVETSIRGEVTENVIRIDSDVRGVITSFQSLSDKVSTLESEYQSCRTRYTELHSVSHPVSLESHRSADREYEAMSCPMQSNQVTVSDANVCERPTTNLQIMTVQPETLPTVSHLLTAPNEQVLSGKVASLINTCADAPVISVCLFQDLLKDNPNLCMLPVADISVNLALPTAKVKVVFQVMLEVEVSGKVFCEVFLVIRGLLQLCIFGNTWHDALNDEVAYRNHIRNS